MIEPERDFCLIHHDPENLCSIPCGDCKQQAKVARAYGDQCRRAGAEAMREERKFFRQVVKEHGLTGLTVGTPLGEMTLEEALEHFDAPPPLSHQPPRQPHRRRGGG